MNYTDLTQEEIFEDIKECCKRMKISYGVAQRAMELGDHQCHLYLHDLLCEECHLRTEKKIQNDVRDAGFPRRYSLEEFDTSVMHITTDHTLEHLTSLEFFEERENIVMVGNSGTGKTMFSIILGIKLIEQGATVRFFRTMNLLERLREEKARGIKSGYLASESKADVLIIDEFGYIPYEVEEARLLFEFISEVYMAKSIILTAHIDFSDWAEVLSEDRLTVPFVGRIIQDAVIIRFTGKDRRMQSKKA